MSEEENELVIEHLESKVARGTINGKKFNSVLKGSGDHWNWQHSIEGIKGERGLHILISRSLDIRQREQAIEERDKALT